MKSKSIKKGFHLAKRNFKELNHNSLVKIKAGEHGGPYATSLSHIDDN